MFIGLEIRYTVIPYRGFESLLLRQSARMHAADRPPGALLTVLGTTWKSPRSPQEVQCLRSESVRKREFGRSRRSARRGLYHAGVTAPCHQCFICP